MLFRSLLGGGLSLFFFHTLFFTHNTHTINCYDTKARTANKRATKNSNKKMWPREHVCALTPAHVNEKGDVQLYSAYSYALKHKHTSTETLTRTQISPTWHESPIRFCKYVYEGLVAGFSAGALGSASFFFFKLCRSCSSCPCRLVEQGLVADCWARLSRNVLLSWLSWSYH